MKRFLKKLRNRQGVTLVEMTVAAGVLALLGLVLHTGLFMAQDSYNKMVEESESRLLLSTLSNLLSDELRYARKVVTNDEGVLQRYTSINHGRNTTLSISQEGQLEANNRRMLSSGAYGNGVYRIEDFIVTYDADSVFQVTLKVTGDHTISKETSFSVRCLNQD